MLRRDLEFAERVAAVDEHSATRCQCGRDARQRLTSCLRVASVKRIHPDSEDYFEGEVIDL